MENFECENNFMLSVDFLRLSFMENKGQGGQALLYIPLSSKIKKKNTLTF